MRAGYRRRLLLPALAALVLAVAGCGGEVGGEGAAVPTSAPRETIEVRLSEYRIEPAHITIDEPGVYRFRARNTGTTLHALRLRGEDFEIDTPQIGPGQRTALSADLPAGTYELICPVLDHVDRGMLSEVVVADA